MPKKQAFVKLPTGETLDLYYIGTFAEKVGRKAQTIKRWHDLNILPQTYFFDKDGCRLYSEEMICVVERALRLSGAKRGRRIDLSPFSPTVYREWDKLKRKYMGTNPRKESNNAET